MRGDGEEGDKDFSLTRRRAYETPRQREGTLKSFLSTG